MPKTVRIGHNCLLQNNIDLQRYNQYLDYSKQERACSIMAIFTHSIIFV